MQKISQRLLRVEAENTIKSRLSRCLIRLELTAGLAGTVENQSLLIAFNQRRVTELLCDCYRFPFRGDGIVKLPQFCVCGCEGVEDGGIRILRPLTAGYALRHRLGI
jgi:hypothetical protein